MLLSKSLLIAQYCTLVPVTCDNPFYSPHGSTVGRLGNLTKWRPAASDLIIVYLVVVIIHFPNCSNNFSRFRYSYMYIMMFITYICILSDKLQSHIHTFGLLLILSRFTGLPRYSYQPINALQYSNHSKYTTYSHNNQKLLHRLRSIIFLQDEFTGEAVGLPIFSLHLYFYNSSLKVPQNAQDNTNFF